MSDHRGHSGRTDAPTREEFNFLREELVQLKAKLEKLERSTADAVRAQVRYGGTAL